MHSTLLLVRHGHTDWSRTRRVMGRRDLPLNEEGRAKGSALAARFASLELAEVLSSPLVRSVETAEAIAAPHRIEVARDPRLTDVQAGPWEGRSIAEMSTSREYDAFLADPRALALPGAESLAAVRDRAVASIGQALEDNPLGANVLVVTHATVVRVLLAHYLGMNLAEHHRLRVAAGTFSVLRYQSDRELPRVLAINHGLDLDALLG